jgi:hypothetical protein
MDVHHSKYAVEMDTRSPLVTDRQWATPTSERREHEMPTGWKYKSLKFGPVRLPYYASPEAQLMLVSFVCFLCPGKLMRHVRTAPELQLT